MHNRLSVRRYSVSTGAYIQVVLHQSGVATRKKGDGCYKLHSDLSL